MLTFSIFGDGMGRYTNEQLRRRAFERAAWVLRHFWEEQQDDPGRKARVHTRIFDALIPRCHIDIGKSKRGGGHIEHLVPCVKLRDRAFELFWQAHDRSENGDDVLKEVADMLEKFLRIAHIHPEEAHHLDHVCNWKTDMPSGWNFETGSVMERLRQGGVELV
jgi:hypothetical protein